VETFREAHRSKMVARMDLAWQDEPNKEIAVSFTDWL
jgi:hypothetical protein